MQGALNWIPKWFSPDGDESSEEIADDFLDLFINGENSIRAEVGAIRLE
jgi:hypothetical protein